MYHYCIEHNTLNDFFYMFQDRVVHVNAHDFRNGGVKSVSFSADASRLLTTGHDGTLSCYKWK